MNICGEKERGEKMNKIWVKFILNDGKGRERAQGGKDEKMIIRFHI